MLLQGSSLRRGSFLEEALALMIWFLDFEGNLTTRSKDATRASLPGVIWNTVHPGENMQAKHPSGTLTWVQRDSAASLDFYLSFWSLWSALLRLITAESEHLGRTCCYKNEQGRMLTTRRNVWSLVGA